MGIIHAQKEKTMRKYFHIPGEIITALEEEIQNLQLEIEKEDSLEDGDSQWLRSRKYTMEELLAKAGKLFIQPFPDKEETVKFAHDWGWHIGNAIPAGQPLLNIAARDNAAEAYWKWMGQMKFVHAPGHGCTYCMPL